jgi:hypothetical protein
LSSSDQYFMVAYLAPVQEAGSFLDSTTLL